MSRYVSSVVEEMFDCAYCKLQCARRELELVRDKDGIYACPRCGSWTARYHNGSVDSVHISVRPSGQ